MAFCKYCAQKVKQNGVICVMKRKLTLNEAVRESIALALIKLMKKKPLPSISVSEIVQVAGVSRSSFYRNFESKEDVLSFHIHTLYADFFAFEEFAAAHTPRTDIRAFLLPRFRFIRENREFFTVLKENHLLFFIFDRLEAQLISRLSGFGEQMPKYFAATFSGACAGVVRLWIDSDFAESEEELVELFARINA